MATFLSILKILPALLAAVIGSVHAVEAAFKQVAAATGSGAAKSGAAKAALVASAVQAAIGVTDAVSGAVSPEVLSAAVAKITDSTVDAFNSTGLFSHGQ